MLASSRSATRRVRGDGPRPTGRPPSDGRAIGCGGPGAVVGFVRVPRTGAASPDSRTTAGEWHKAGDRLRGIEAIMTALRDYRRAPYPLDSEFSEAAALGARAGYASCKPANDVVIALALPTLSGPPILPRMALGDCGTGTGDGAVGPHRPARPGHRHLAASPRGQNAGLLRLLGITATPSRGGRMRPPWTSPVPRPRHSPPG